MHPCAQYTLRALTCHTLAFKTGSRVAQAIVIEEPQELEMVIGELWEALREHSKRLRLLVAEKLGRGCGSMTSHSYRCH